MSWNETETISLHAYWKTRPVMTNSFSDNYDSKAASHYWSAHVELSLSKTTFIESNRLYNGVKINECLCPISTNYLNLSSSECVCWHVTSLPRHKSQCCIYVASAICKQIHITPRSWAHENMFQTRWNRFCCRQPNNCFFICKGILSD